MTDDEPTAAARGKTPIKELNPCDVLFGRGIGPSNYVGNQQFRKIIDEYKTRYQQAPRNKPKARIAKEIYNHIHSLGGRFLRLDENAAQVEFAAEDPREWYESEEKAALEKIKQSLRQKRTNPKKASPSKPKQDKASTNMIDGAEDNLAIAPDAASLDSFNAHIPSDLARVETPPDPFDSIISSGPSSPIRPLQLTGIDGGSSAFDPRLLLFQSPNRSFCPAQSANPYVQNSGFRPYLPDSYLSVGELPYALLSTSQSALTPTFTGTSLEPDSFGTSTPNPAHDLGKKRSRYPSNGGGSGSECRETMQVGREQGAITASEHVQENQDDVLHYLLSVLALSDRPTFSEQQSDLEKASLSDREREDILSDLLGQTSSFRSHEGKKPRKDLDGDSLDFLVQQMRLEIDGIPVQRKEALTEAQHKAALHEFSDERLAKFLRCEGMNAKLAATRFANYWQSRREVFGPDKYVQRMTLSEALSDDLVAIEKAVYCLLPGLDANDRPIIYHTPSWHTREGGYSSESLLRAVWYIIEVASQENNGVHSSIVEVMWCKNSTLWDYDRKIHDRINYFRDNAWPVRVAALHVCCLSGFLVRIMKPIMMAMKTKSSRCRTLFHDVADTEILQVLAGYGLVAPSLPTTMGGTLRFDHSEWIAKRRAVELEEIDY